MNGYKVDSDQWVYLAEVVGSVRIPESAAFIIKEALEKMTSNGDISERNPWQAIEYWAADYLQGPDLSEEIPEKPKATEKTPKKKSTSRRRKTTWKN